AESFTRRMALTFICERFFPASAVLTAPQSSLRQNSQPILAASTQSTNPIFNRSFEGRRFGERVFRVSPWAECYVRLKQSSSRDRSSSVEEGFSQAQTPGSLQVYAQRTMGRKRRVVCGRAGRDLRPARAERFGQIDADSDS